MKTTEQILQRIAMARGEMNDFMDFIQQEEKLLPDNERTSSYIALLKGEVNKLASEILTLKWVLES